MKNFYILLAFLTSFVSVADAQYCNTATTNDAITPTSTAQQSASYSSGRRAFSFAATAGCTYVFETCGLSTNDTYLRLYSTGTGGTILAQNDDACGTQSRITWTCATTGTYSILMTRFSCNTLSASTRLSYRISSCGPPPTPPANDVCSNATPLPCGTTGLAGTTVNSVVETAPSGCASQLGVWYKFTGDGQQTTISSTAAFDHELTIVSGSCGAFTDVACVDLGIGTNSTETYTFTTTNGLQYYVYVAHWQTSSSTTGTFSISRSCTPPPTPPSNDLVCNATPITCGETLNGTTINGTNSGTGESSTCGVSQGTNGVWYSFQGNGQMVLASLCGSTWDSKISVYSGTCSSLTCVGGNDDDGPGCYTTSASYTFQTQVGTTYFIKVHGYSINSAFSLALTCGGSAAGTTSPGNVPACVFTSAPTSSTQTTSCTYPYGVAIGGGTQVDRCFEFVATNSSLNWQMYNLTDCFGGGLIASGTWGWQCYDVSNNLISSSTTLANPMLISNLVVGQTYRICYSFIHADGCSSSNFQPYVYGPNVLPIDLLSFTGENIKNENIINWITSSETNNDYFIIEHSFDLNDWVKLNNIKGNNSPSMYEYIHSNPRNVVNYYKLVQVDFDGTKHNKGIISIDNRKDEPEIIGIYNVLGQPVTIDFVGLKIINYSDGTTKKTY